jgi:HD-like signal output (HDOD) protein
VIENFKNLYPMPHVMAKARRVMADPNAGFDRLAHVLRADPGLAGRIVKVANSAYYRRRGNIASVQQAAALLGMRVVSQIITLVSQSRMLGQALSGYDMEAGALWRHSLATAVLAEVLAGRAGGEYASEAFLAGLMHDAGKIILNPYLEQSGSVVRSGAGSRTEAVEAEIRTLGFDHADIGSELCIKWQLPVVLANAIRFHHMPRLSVDNGLAYILELADFLAHRMAAPPADSEAWDGVAHSLDRLRLTPEKAAGTIQDVEARLEMLEEETL